MFSLLWGIIGSTPEARAHYSVDGHPPREGDVLPDPELAATLDRLGAEGAPPFYTGDIGTAVADWVRERGGTLTREDLAAYQVVRREPIQVTYRGREVYTNPPPSAGGLLLAFALNLLAGTPGPPDQLALVQAMRSAQEARTPEFFDGLAAPGFGRGFLSASRLGSTTHISVLDTDGWACSVTCSNGEGSGLVVPGTGVHVNNMLGEEDLSPHGLFAHPTGRRLPSMMAPTVVRRHGVPELVLGSAGSNRIRSALLQVIVNAVDRGMEAQPAVDAPRLHVEDGMVYAEPGVDIDWLTDAGQPVTRFREPSVFFGGCQAVERHRVTGALSGGGDPRRGGAVVVV
jgi:gamma-glutamyltranspeptidase/glutathione hydrolase